MKKIFFITALYTFQGFGQSPVLEAYIREGIEGNLALKQQTLEIEKSLKAIDIAKSNLFPRIAFNPNYTLAAGGRSIEFPIGDLLNPVYGSLNKLTQSNNFPSIENEKIQFAPNNFHETKFTFELPLFNSDIKYNVLIKKDLVKTEEAKRKLIEFELKYAIESAYYQYIQSLEALGIYASSGEFLNTLVDFNERLNKNDLALKDIIFSAKYEINKLDIQKADAEKNSKIAKAYFNFLINRPFDATIEVDSSISKTVPFVQEIEALTSNALVERPEFAQFKAGRNTNNTLLKMQQIGARRPSFYLGGSSGFQGYGYSFGNQAYAIAQVGMKWELAHGKEKKHQIEQTKIQTKIIDTKHLEAIQQIEMQVVSAFFELESSLIKLEYAEKGTTNTKGFLEIVEKKYKNTEALYIEVSKAQNDLMTSKLQASMARYDVWLKKAQLDKVSAQ
jgi:outer membrane protein